MKEEVIVAASDTEIEACYPVMRQLRPQVSEAEFVARVRRQEREGYRLAYLPREGRPAAVAGYRVIHNLVSGRILYVDDLVTDRPARSQGLGARLLAWLLGRAAAEKCDSLQLDSGVQRKDAHRFYFREGLVLSSYRLKRDLR